MLNLAATTDKLQLVTSAAVTVDVHASYVDLSGTTVTPGRKNTAITTAATTDIVASPAGSTVRNIKTLHIRNKHATSPVDVTVLYEGSATDADVELHKVTLLAGETLEYIEGVGFFTVQLVRKVFFNRRVTTDVINATTSFADVTGLTCPVEAGKHYNFDAGLFHIENASTTGARFGVNGPAMTAMRLHEFGGFAGAVGAGTMQANVGDVTALDTAAIAATSSAGTPQVIVAFLTGWINPSAAGTFAVRCASEVAVAAGITVKAGSWLQLWEADN
jgi:hypothetical protein